MIEIVPVWLRSVGETKQSEKYHKGRIVNVERHKLHGVIPKGGPVLEPFHANFNIDVLPSGEISVEEDSIETTQCWIRPKQGICRGIYTDYWTARAALVDAGVTWLQRKLEKPLLTPPRPDPTIRVTRWMTKGDQYAEVPIKIDRSCITCRWGQKAEFGTDEWILDQFDFSDVTGEVTRGMKWDGTMTPTWRCTLFSVWIEEHFGILDQFNALSETEQNSGLVNLRMGYSSMPMPHTAENPWLRRKSKPGEGTREKLDPDDTPPPKEPQAAIFGDDIKITRLGKEELRNLLDNLKKPVPIERVETDPTGEWANKNWLLRKEIEKCECQFHREQTKFRSEDIPIGWLPRIDEDRIQLGSIYVEVA